MSCLRFIQKAGVLRFFAPLLGVHIKNIWSVTTHIRNHENYEFDGNSDRYWFLFIVFTDHIIQLPPIGMLKFYLNGIGTAIPYDPENYELHPNSHFRLFLRHCTESIKICFCDRKNYELEYIIGRFYIIFHAVFPICISRCYWCTQTPSEVPIFMFTIHISYPENYGLDTDIGCF